MLKRLLERLIVWAFDNRADREAAKVAKMYADTLDAAVAATHDPRNGWHDGYDLIEVPTIGKPKSPPCDVRSEVSLIRHCVCAVSSKRYPGRISARSSLPEVHLGHVPMFS